MFKTKGFSSNNSLKRRDVIVDAPDLPPEECEFYITSVGISDTDKVDFPSSEDLELDIEIEHLYEENSIEDSTSFSLTHVKGIGQGTADNLNDYGIKTIEELLLANPETLSEKINGISSKKVVDWQTSAKILLKT